MMYSGVHKFMQYQNHPYALLRLHVSHFWRRIRVMSVLQDRITYVDVTILAYMHSSYFRVVGMCGSNSVLTIPQDKSS